jgi:hypothetical protein
LLKDNGVNFCFLAQLDCLLKIKLLSNLISKSTLLHQLISILIVSFSNLQLNFETSSVFVFNVLRTSKATEYTTANHDAHFG